MSLAVDIVKRNQRKQSFDQDKLRRSLQLACLSVQTPEGAADMAARNACHHILIWLENKPEITSHDLRRKAAEALAPFYPEAAYIYQHHHQIL